MKKWFLIMWALLTLAIFGCGNSIVDQIAGLQEQIDGKCDIDDCQGVVGPQGEAGPQGEPGPVGPQGPPGGGTTTPAKIHVCHCQPDRFNAAMQMVRECHTLFVDVSALTTHMAIHDDDYIGPCE